MTFLTDTTTAGRLRRRLPSFGALFALARQRRALAVLDTERLRDIGVTRAQALQEAHRPIWDIPEHWSEN
ncbi:DUF1127 domain-containing protein [Roseovarius aestuariivivens]|uniref:DUF1127 domain-containing protein n=1 Tax=Roseovarius aestuariivivens TaxID=1888910 RepID=UPI00107FFF74|nr:DUF1127 domain-containing protein [Roseovarius aestuariivivens]